MTGVIVTIVVLLVIIAVIAVVAMQMRRKKLQDQFGPEYDRAVEHGDSRLGAERDLAARKKRVDQLEIRPLATEARQRYEQRWTEVQADFVDSPNSAVGHAQDLVNEVMRERGYPTDDPDQRMEDLSVEHADVMDNYRAAHDISIKARGYEAPTEDLRQAMVHYRTLFESLLGHDGARSDDRANGTDATGMRGTSGAASSPESRLDAQEPMSRRDDDIDVRDRQRTEGTR